jgi:DNA-binding XRE family transcriptional regulator
MEAQMKINGELVRTLREGKSWSQEHLASASGLSARTIQRVESDGMGSAETRLALAAALGVPVAALMESPKVGNALGSVRLPLWGWIGWGVGGVCSVGLLSLPYVMDAIALPMPLKYVMLNLVPWLAVAGLSIGAVATTNRWRRARAAAQQPVAAVGSR